MRRLISLALALGACLAVALPSTAMAQKTTVNTSTYPLSGSVMFPARNQRIALRCQNALTNHAATVTHDGFSMVLQPGGSLWMEVQGQYYSGRVPSGVITSTGTSGETLNCIEVYN